MVHRDTFVIGASAGGVEALSRLFQRIPASFPGVFFVVLHTVPAAESKLPEILNRAGSLNAKHVEDNEPVVPGTIYVARPNYHLTIEGNLIRSATGPRQDGYRPSVNVLFESAARAWGDRVAGIVLSGSLDDGTLGLTEIKRAGGITIVQDPSDAMFSGMPQSALDRVDIDFSGSVDQIADKILEVSGEFEVVTHTGVPNGSVQPNHPENPAPSLENSTNTVAGYTCPECGGVLQEAGSGDFAHYRCQVGHRLSEGTLLQAQSEQIERALWTALRVLEERIAIAERVSRRAEASGRGYLVRHFARQNQEAYETAQVLRNVLMGSDKTLTITALQDEPALTSGDDDDD